VYFNNNNIGQIPLFILVAVTNKTSAPLSSPRCCFLGSVYFPDQRQKNKQGGPMTMAMAGAVLPRNHRTSLGLFRGQQHYLFFLFVVASVIVRSRYLTKQKMK